MPPCPSPTPGVHSDSNPLSQVMPSSHLILCRLLLLLPPIPPSIRVFFNESTLRMRWPKYSVTDKRCSWSLAASQQPRAPLGQAWPRSPSSQSVGNRASGQHVDLGSVTTPSPGGSGIGLGWLRGPNPPGSSGSA